jgi:ABC-type transporter Mla maintaining outer membrane lipid asymmetry ATPase subunit MlaF
MASVFRLADQVALLSEGRIAFAGTPDELRASDNPDVRAFLALSTSRLSESSTAQPVEAEAAATNPLAVQVSGLVKSFSGRAVLRSVNFTAEQGRITSLIGGSGSGKSVLMKHLLGLLRPDGGTVSVLGSDVLALPDAELRALRRRIGMLFQGAALFDSLSVFDNCAFPLREAGERLSLREATPVVTEVLDRLSLAELARRMPSELSAGQRKRVALARALVTRPEMLIYDEPTTGLDPVLTASVNEMIVEAQENFGVTSVVVSHDMASTFRISHSVAMLFQGELLLQGAPSDFMQSADERIRAFVFAGSAAEA